MSSKPSVEQLVLAYFMKHPKKVLKHDDWVDEVSAQYKALNGTNPRDPWRAARKLYQHGNLIQIGKGLYMYDPDYISHPKLEDFTDEQKAIILKRDNYRCTYCGRGLQDGVELHVDHMKPKSRGGNATIENGQTLCGEHNYRKKNYDQIEAGKKMFILLYGVAKNIGDTKMVNFVEDVLKVYAKHEIDGHIVWDDEG